MRWTHRLAAMSVVVLCLMTVARGDTKTVDHTFTFKPADGQTPTSVNLAGDFNGWSTTATPMKNTDGTFTATVPLTPGMHTYKFVLDGKNWTEDPAADKSLEQDDGNGGHNSAVNISASDAPPAATPAAAPSATPSAAPPGNGPQEHTFTYTPAAGEKPSSVAVAGDFNGWSTTATPMTDKNGTFTATVKLAPGDHQYKFVVDGSDWKNDPSADASLQQPDGQGGANSVVRIGSGAAASGSPAASQDGYTFRYTPAAGEKPSSVAVAGDFNNWSTTATPMKEDNGTYTATVKLPPGVHQYKFVIDGSTWKNDPNADTKLDQPDGQGGKNSAVQIGDAPGGAAHSDAAHGDASSQDALPQASDERLAGGEYNHEFYYRPEPGHPARSVAVAGDFNGWSTTADPMTYSGGAFRKTVPMAEGVHLYKYVVDGNWTADPNGDPLLSESDGFGGKNSAVLVGVDGRKLPPPQPNTINAVAIMYDARDMHDWNVVDAGHVRISLRCQANGVQSVLAYVQEADQSWTSRTLYKVQTRVGIDRYAAMIAVPVSTQPARYFFKLTNGSATDYVCGADGVTSMSAAEAQPLETSAEVTFQTPQWAQHAVWYQIFPERFRNGDTANDPPNPERWTSNWYATQPGESGKLYNDVWKRRYGGDFQGIDQELPYLRSLGINAIYLNPIFKAEDLHKYDTSDYRHVDDHFGFAGDINQLHCETDDPATWQWTRTDKLFLDFVADAHKQGFKVIIDGVFNHTGTAFYAFQDVKKNGRASRYADWYKITSWQPFHWTGWGGDKDGALPEFRKDDKLGLVHGPRELVLNIARRWLAPDGDPSKGVDGFRLDAAENVPHAFWIEFRNVVKSVKPDALIDGEIWTVSPAYVSGNQFDCMMDYPFAELMESFFVDQKEAYPPSVFANGLSSLAMAYPFQVMLCEQNLLDSHDTDRWASRFVNPDLPFNAKSRIQDNNPNYNPAKPTAQDYTRMMQSLVVQFTYAGAPMIYYGDETGMWGPSDPSDRQPMIWKDLEPYDDPQVKFNQRLFDQYQRLIAIHAARPELQTGFPRTILTDDAEGLFGFARDLAGHHTAVVVNRSDTPHDVQVAFGPADQDVKCVDWLDRSDVHLSDSSDARPTIDGGTPLTARRGHLNLRLGAWDSAIVSGDWN